MCWYLFKCSVKFRSQCTILPFPRFHIHDLFALISEIHSLALIMQLLDICKYTCSQVHLQFWFHLNVHEINNVISPRWLRLLKQFTKYSVGIFFFIIRDLNSSFEAVGLKSHDHRAWIKFY